MDRWLHRSWTYSDVPPQDDRHRSYLARVSRFPLCRSCDLFALEVHAYRMFVLVEG